MKKLLSFFLVIVMVLMSAVTLVSCGGGNPKVTAPEGATVVKVKIYKAGYGIEWLETAIAKFNELYKSQNYFVMIEEAEGTVSETAPLEIRDTKKNDTDLYFINAVSIPQYIEYSASVMRNGFLLEDLSTDVYSKPAIKFDGTEEGVSIESKLKDSAKQYYIYRDTTNEKYSNLLGKYFSFPWATGASGIYTNREMLATKGGAPRTTDELIAQIRDIQAEQDDTHIYPMTFAGQNAMGYWEYMFDTLFAQYSGVEAENNFWNLPLTADGYKAYQDVGLLEALKVLEQVCSYDLVKAGTNNFAIGRAQSELLEQTSLYMVTGNWVYNEMKNANPDKVQNLQMIKMPVISALGTKLGITDAKLSAIIKDIDDGVAEADIATKNEVSSDVVSRVKEARCVFFNSSIDHQALIPSYSKEKEVAKLFLRFLASDDFLDEYKAKTNSSLPFNYEGSSKYTLNDYEKSVEAVRGGDAIMLFDDMYTSPMRRAGIMLFGNMTDPTTFENLARGNSTAQSIYDSMSSYVVDSWEAYLMQVQMQMQ